MVIDWKASTGTSLAVIRFESREGIDRRYRQRRLRIRIPVREYLLRTTLSPLEPAVQLAPEEKAGTVGLYPATVLATGVPVLD